THRAAVLSDNLGYFYIRAQVNAVVAVQICRYLRDFVAENLIQRQLGAFQQRDIGISAAGRRGSLQANPATADDDKLLILAKGFAEGIGIFNGAKVEDIVRIRAGDGKLSHRVTGGRSEEHTSEL